MRQLTGADTSFLNMETQTTVGHVGALALFDLSDFKGDSFFELTRRVVAERLHEIPVFRWKLVEVPLGLDFPYWIDDPEFDLDFHVRHIAVPPPGTREQLSELACRLHSRPLDRSRPLWELYVIEGIEGGLVAQYSKIHHAAIDGSSGNTLVTTLLDLTPEGREVLPPAVPQKPEAMPTDLDLFWRGAAALLQQPFRAVQWSYRAARALPLGQMLPSVRDVRRRIFGPREGEVVEKPTDPAPRTPLNRVISGHRRFAYGHVPLADMKLIKNSFGTTLNDVVMAICATTLRRWLQDHDALPATPLYAGVPISLRSADQMNDYRNRISMMIAALGTHITDPVERLRFCQEAMKGAKERHGAIPANVLTDATQFTPPALAALASRVAAQTRLVDYVTPPFNVVISNVPGPREALYTAGARQVALYPLSIVTDGGALNITVNSYRDVLDYGFLACCEAVPDVWNMAVYFEEAIAELKRLAERGYGRIRSVS